jgi:hypothetical protein
VTKKVDWQSEDLRRHFLSPPRGATRADGCPEPALIFETAIGESSVEKTRALADHCAECPACSIAWKLAQEYAPESGLPMPAAAEEFSDGRWRAPLWRRWIPAATAMAAALALVALLVPWREAGGPQDPVLRTLGDTTIESRIAEGEALTADRFLLRWSAGPEGARYDVRVTDRRLNLLARAISLERSEYMVPAAALADLEPGSVVLWQVETTLPDGRRIVSRTFATRLE